MPERRLPVTEPRRTAEPRRVKKEKNTGFFSGFLSKLTGDNTSQCSESSFDSLPAIQVTPAVREKHPLKVDPSRPKMNKVASSPFKGFINAVGLGSSNESTPAPSPAVGNRRRQQHFQHSSRVVQGDPFAKVTVSAGDTNSGIQAGAVANTIAKFAHDDAIERSARHHAFHHDDHSTRILGPYSRPRAEWGPEEDIAREAEAYDKSMDPEILVTEAVLMDTWQALNLLIHEFDAYSGSFSHLGSKATTLSRASNDVHQLQTRRRAASRG
jgi:hypothetical protein